MSLILLLNNTSNCLTKNAVGNREKNVHSFIFRCRSVKIYLDGYRSANDVAEYNYSQEINVFYRNNEVSSFDISMVSLLKLDENYEVRQS